MKFEDYRINAYISFHDLKNVPQKFMKFCSEEVCPEYLFYDVKKKNVYCTFCKTDMPLKMLPKRKHNDYSVCPNCRKEVVMRATGFGHRIHDEYCALYIQKYNESIILRYYTIIQDFCNDYRNPICTIKEKYRTLFEEKTSINYEKQNGVWIKSMHPYQLYLKGLKIYRQNINSVLKDTPFKYSCFETFLDKYNYTSPWQYERYFELYLVNPCIEYLYKIKWYNIGNRIFKDHYHFCDLNKNKLYEILRIRKVDYRTLLNKKEEPTENDIINFQQAKIYDISLEEYLMWNKGLGNHYNRFSEFKLFSKYMKAEKFLSYIQTQTGRDVISTYYDYLVMAKKLNFDMKNKSVLFPKNIYEAHDICIELDMTSEYNENLNNAKKLINYNSYINEYKRKYEYSNNDFSIIVPNNCMEIVKEGHKLHHCVGTYIDRVNKGETIILFLRKTNELEHSYYTIEIHNEKIIQCRGKYNGLKTEEINKFLSEYKENKKIA